MVMVSAVDMPSPTSSSATSELTSGPSRSLNVSFNTTEESEVRQSRSYNEGRRKRSSSSSRHSRLVAFFRGLVVHRNNGQRPVKMRRADNVSKEKCVFGCDLVEHLDLTEQDVPRILRACAEFIESHGMIDGIYRLSGVSSNIRKLRVAFDEDRILSLDGDRAVLADIHSVSSLLKMYFRELPNPVCTFQLYDKFVEAARAKDNERLVLMYDVVRQLPPHHYRTLEYLSRHLYRVSLRGHDTGMTAKNVAIVWAPNLLRSRSLELGGVAALQGVGVQAVVTEYLIRYCELIFSDIKPLNNEFCGEFRRLQRPQSLAVSTPSRLMETQRQRFSLLPPSTRTRYIDVGGGPDHLPIKYHTIIDVESKRRSRHNANSFKHRRTPLDLSRLFRNKRRDNDNKDEKEETFLSLEASKALTPNLEPCYLRPARSAEWLWPTSGITMRHQSVQASSRDLEPDASESILAKTLPKTKKRVTTPSSGAEQTIMTLPKSKKSVTDRLTLKPPLASSSLSSSSSSPRRSLRTPTDNLFNRKTSLRDRLRMRFSGSSSPTSSSEPRDSQESIDSDNVHNNCGAVSNNGSVDSSIGQNGHERSFEGMGKEKTGGKSESVSSVVADSGITVINGSNPDDDCLTDKSSTLIGNSNDSIMNECTDNNVKKEALTEEIVQVVGDTSVLPDDNIADNNEKATANVESSDLFNDGVRATSAIDKIKENDTEGKNAENIFETNYKSLIESHESKDENLEEDSNAEESIIVIAEEDHIQSYIKEDVAIRKSIAMESCNEEDNLKVDESITKEISDVNNDDLNAEESFIVITEDVNAESNNEITNNIGNLNKDQKEIIKEDEIILQNANTSDHNNDLVLTVLSNQTDNKDENFSVTSNDIKETSLLEESQDLESNEYDLSVESASTSQQEPIELIEALDRSYDDDEEEKTEFKDEKDREDDDKKSSREDEDKKDLKDILLDEEVSMVSQSETVDVYNTCSTKNIVEKESKDEQKSNAIKELKESDINLAKDSNSSNTLEQIVVDSECNNLSAEPIHKDSSIEVSEQLQEDAESMTPLIETQMENKEISSQSNSPLTVDQMSEFPEVESRNIESNSSSGIKDEPKNHEEEKIDNDGQDSQFNMNDKTDFEVSLSSLSSTSSHLDKSPLMLLTPRPFSKRIVSIDLDEQSEESNTDELNKIDCNNTVTNTNNDTTTFNDNETNNSNDENEDSTCISEEDQGTVSEDTNIIQDIDSNTDDNNESEGLVSNVTNEEKVSNKSSKSDRRRRFQGRLRHNRVKSTTCLLETVSASTEKEAMDDSNGLLQRRNSIHNVPFVDTEDPETRERIERYKEERRSMLRARFRAEDYLGETNKYKTTTATSTTTTNDKNVVTTSEGVVLRKMRVGSSQSPSSPKSFIPVHSGLRRATSSLSAKNESFTPKTATMTSSSSSASSSRKGSLPSVGLNRLGSGRRQNLSSASLELRREISQQPRVTSSHYHHNCCRPRSPPRESFRKINKRKEANKARTSLTVELERKNENKNNKRNSEENNEMVTKNKAGDKETPNRIRNMAAFFERKSSS